MFSAVLALIAFALIVSLLIVCRKIKRESEHLRVIQKEKKMLEESLENLIESEEGNEEIGKGEVEDGYDENREENELILL